MFDLASGLFIRDNVFVWQTDGSVFRKLCKCQLLLLKNHKKRARQLRDNTENAFELSKVSIMFHLFQISV